MYGSCPTMYLRLIHPKSIMYRTPLMMDLILQWGAQRSLSVLLAQLSNNRQREAVEFYLLVFKWWTALCQHPYQQFILSKLIVLLYSSWTSSPDPTRTPSSEPFSVYINLYVRIVHKGCAVYHSRTQVGGSYNSSPTISRKWDLLWRKRSFASYAIVQYIVTFGAVSFDLIASEREHYGWWIRNVYERSNGIWFRVGGLFLKEPADAFGSFILFCFVWIV